MQSDQLIKLTLQIKLCNSGRRQWKFGSYILALIYCMHNKYQCSLLFDLLEHFSVYTRNISHAKFRVIKNTTWPKLCVRMNVRPICDRWTSNSKTIKVAILHIKRILLTTRCTVSLWKTSCITSSVFHQLYFADLGLETSNVLTNLLFSCIMGTVGSSVSRHHFRH